MNDYENVKFDADAKKKILAGAKLVYEAVRRTYGPKASNMCIKTPAGVSITKDGATVAQWVNDSDPYVSMGIELMQNISIKTAKDVGDASSTAIILSQAILDCYQGTNDAIQLTRDLAKECQIVIDWLKTKRRVITSEEDLIKVATIATNGDAHLGELVGKAFYKTGIDGVVTFSESEDVSDSVEYSQGFRIESGYASPYFINNPSGGCTLENVYVHISDVAITDYSKIVPVANYATEKGKSLLVIAPKFDSEVFVFLSNNLSKLKSCVVTSPNFGNYRDIMIKDLKHLFGDSGICEKVVITKDNTTFIGYTPDEGWIKTEVQNIRKVIEENNVPEFDINFQKKRLANFTSGSANIKIGGFSKVEIKEKLDRVEDAVRATQCALQEGILPGGGLALLNACHDLQLPVLSIILATPFMTLVDYDEQKAFLGQSFWNGYDVKSNKVCDFYENGIIDPFLVVTRALENAVNTASLILTIAGAIIKMNIYE